MQPIPLPLQKQFETYLKNKDISGRSWGSYKKWPQYYLDFCQKYDFPPNQKESLPGFIQKLQEKRQTKTQRHQAAEAITLYYQIVKERELLGQDKTNRPETLKEHKPFENGKPLNSLLLTLNQFITKRLRLVSLMNRCHHQTPGNLICRIKHLIQVHRRISRRKELHGLKSIQCWRTKYAYGIIPGTPSGHIEDG